MTPNIPRTPPSGSFWRWARGHVSWKKTKLGSGWWCRYCHQCLGYGQKGVRDHFSVCPQWPGGSALTVEIPELTVEIKVTKGSFIVFHTISPAFLSHQWMADNPIIENNPNNLPVQPYVFKGFVFQPLVAKIKSNQERYEEV